MTAITWCWTSTRATWKPHAAYAPSWRRSSCRSGAFPKLIDRDLYLGKDIPLGGTAHQAGTCRFGPDPATSVLDLDCKAHELDNLYITDASFFPSIGAVNPT